MNIRKLLLLLLLISSVSVNVCYGKGKSMSRSTYSSLQDIQKLLTDEKFANAVTELNKLYGEIDKDTMDEAVVLQTLGYAEMGLSQYPKAITHLKKSVDLAMLPESAELNTRYLVAQLLASQGKYREALDYASIWYSKLKKVKPTHRIFMANLYAQLKQFKYAIELARKAIDESDKPRESWFQLLVASYFETRQYDKTAGALKEVLALWPDKKAYWEQLASINMMMDRDSETLAVLQLAWMQGLLDKEASIKTLVQFAISQGIPERAARILDSAIRDKKIEANEKNLEVLSTAWSASRETDKAINSLLELAKVSSDGKPLVKLARLYLDKEQWGKAQDVLQQAIDKGLKDESQAWLLLGIAYVQGDKFDQAKKALKRARAFTKIEKQASAWLKYTDQKLQNRNWLTRSS